MTALRIITFPCPKCKMDMAAFDEEKIGVYVGTCDDCKKSFEVSLIGEGEYLIKEVRIS